MTLEDYPKDFLDTKPHCLYAWLYLAKLGIQCWGPNLKEGLESLFNSAFQIAALKTFWQVAGTGRYDFMNFINSAQSNGCHFVVRYCHEHVW
ncbi:hypothetical protein VP01_2720g4 [Puccinia sorghi]|uniref:Uncharacterized protein n=1 Tax=Puccinia sorghi TaxID=27349 RepID=A0A0L6V3C9_9BASI|nr:hypothetical protein VP01_2720g4 [Puccinia sorghi]